MNKPHFRWQDIYGDGVGNWFMRGVGWHIVTYDDWRNCTKF